MSETIDLSQNRLILSVICNKPCSEGYDVTNLISSNFFENSKGFLAERFISPPVMLTFEFKCSIYIKYIVIKCTVGAQKTSGIELFSQCKPDCEYVSIASGVLEESKDGFVFHRFNEDVKQTFGGKYHCRTFRPNACPYLSPVKRIQIKIFRTSRTSVPGIGKVNFFGFPLEYKIPKPKEVSMCNAVRREFPKKKELLRENSLELQKPSASTSKHNLNLCIPEEFLDPITFEIMIQPVIMPSGKIINNTTMDMYEKEERRWGRGPSDPFTNVLFTESSKPVAATDLKARIDRYLSINSDHSEFYNIPRTVGRRFPYMPGNHNTKMNVSTLIKQSSPNLDYISTRNLDYEVQTKRQKVEHPFDSCCSVNYNDLKSNQSGQIIVSNSHYGKTVISNKSTLSKLPSVTSNIHNDYKVSCNDCKSTDNLFSIPCNHAICRSCLLKDKQIIQRSCLSCSFLYKTNNVIRVHLP